MLLIVRHVALTRTKSQASSFARHNGSSSAGNARKIASERSILMYAFDDTIKCSAQARQTQLCHISSADAALGKLVRLNKVHSCGAGTPEMYTALVFSMEIASRTSMIKRGSAGVPSGH